MSYKNMSGDNEEVYVFVDEDGNEVIVDENLNEVGLEETYAEETVSDYMAEDEITMEEEYELEDAFEDEDGEQQYDDGDGGILGSIANKMLVVFGVMIALIAIGIGIFFMSRKGGGAADFSKVGKKFTEIGVVGGSKIEEITSIRGAQLDALYQAQDSYDYDEADTEEGITTVSITLTSILKDLKIKFVNSKGKLIANVPFEVEVTGPDGKSVKWTDTDKDGIIYQTELSGGAYSVKVIPLNGYEKLYDFSKADKQSCSVKTQLDYQKVDVKNEIKSSSKVASTEDVSKKETQEEGKNKDTVAFVESAKKASSSGYTPIAKGSVQDPMSVLKKTYEAGVGRFFRLSGPVNVTDSSSTSGNEGTGNESGNGSGEGNQGGEGGQGSGEGGQGGGTTTQPTYDAPTEAASDGKFYHTVHNTDGTSSTELCDNQPGGTCSKCGHTAPALETETKYVEKDGKYYKQTVDKSTKEVKTETEVTPTYQHIDGQHKHKVLLDGNPFKEEDCADTSSPKDYKCNKCGADMPKEALKSKSLTVSPTSTSIGVNVSTELTAKATCEPTTYKAKSIVWSVDNDKIVSLGSTSGEKITVKGLAAGTATITCVVTFDDPLSSTASTTVKVSVGNVSMALDYNGKKVVTFVGGDAAGNSLKLNLALTGIVTGEVEWSVSDSSVITIDKKDKPDSITNNKGTITCVVKALKAGNAKITVKSKENSSQTQTVEIVVQDPRHDYTTKLLDSSGNPVYVLDASTNKYKEATYANYYTGETLYSAVAVTYIYTGWWQLDGKTYYFDANGNKVTGDQVICGAKYSFGSDGALKSGTGTFGIDVSKWNGTIDWSRVAKSGVSYAIIRCGFRGTTVGGLVADEKFKANVTNAQAAGIKVGVYFYSQAVTEAEAVEEASTCLTLIDTYKVKPTYPIFIDIESAGAGSRTANMNKAQRTAVANAFCKTITNAGYKAGVYSNKTWLTNNIDTASLTAYTIWLAQYAQAPTYTATRYDIWQYSDNGTVGGISSKVDLDLSYMGY